MKSETTEYEEIEVEISRSLGCQDRLEVRILESPFNRPREFFTAPLETAELDSFLAEWDQLHKQEDFPSAQRRRALAEDLGGKLFQSLFQGKLGATLNLCQAAQAALRRHKNLGLRLRLSFGDPAEFPAEVVRLPWELLYQSSPPGRFLCQSSKTQVVRYLDFLDRIQPLETEPPLKVLAVLCSPEDQPPIDLDQLQEQLRAASFRKSKIDIDYLPIPTIPALRRELAQGGYHVLHYVGHGSYRSSDGEGVLYFETPDGKTDWVTGRELANQLEDINTLRLAVLNTCLGARMLGGVAQSPFAGAATALVAIGIPAVVAMQFPISVKAAGAMAFEVDIAAHASVAFAAGYLMQVKTGARISVCQRGRQGLVIMDPLEASPPDAPKWKRSRSLPESFPLTAGSNDVAVLISLTNEVLPGVELYFRSEDRDPPKVGHVIHAEIGAEEGTRQQSVRNGGHAYRLAESLVTRIHRFTSGQRENGTLHVFAAAPNSVLFFLGQLSRRFPRIQLYEYGFGGTGTYSPSITLPRES